MMLEKDLILPGGFMSAPQVQRVELLPPQRVTMCPPPPTRHAMTAAYPAETWPIYLSDRQADDQFPTITRQQWICKEHVYRQWHIRYITHKPETNDIIEYGHYIDFVSWVWMKED